MKYKNNETGHTEELSTIEAEFQELISNTTEEWGTLEEFLAEYYTTE